MQGNSFNAFSIAKFGRRRPLSVKIYFFSLFPYSHFNYISSSHRLQLHNILYMSLSGPKIQAIMSRPTTASQRSLFHTPILLSDSKGSSLQNKASLNFVEFWCQSGLQTRKAIDQLESRLESRGLASALIYIWLDTTKKKGTSHKFVAGTTPL